MPRIYTRIFSDAAYAARLPSSKPAVHIAAGMKRVVRLKMGSEGRVTDVSVKELAGGDPTVAFKVDLLKSQVPFPQFDQDILSATVPVDSLELYNVFPQLSGVAGGTAELESNEIGYAYKNMDGTWTDNQPWLYMVISPVDQVGAGNETVWEIAITVERDIGN